MQFLAALSTVRIGNTHDKTPAATMKPALINKITLMNKQANLKITMNLDNLGKN